MPPTNKHARSFTGGMMALVAVLALSLVLMISNAFIAEKVNAAVDIAKATTWAQTVSGLYDSSPSTLADGEIDALRLDAKGGLVVAGHVAHDAADAGNPLKIGGIGRSVWETAASTAGDRVNASFDLFGRLRVDPGYAASDAWYIKHRPAAGTQATISKAAGAAGVKHVCTGFMVTFASLGAPTPEIIGIQIRDGATGAGTIMWEGSISLPAVAGTSRDVGMTGLWLVGTAATAMTIETDAGGGANDYLSVSLQGVSIK